MIESDILGITKSYDTSNWGVLTYTFYVQDIAIRLHSTRYVKGITLINPAGTRTTTPRGGRAACN